MRRIGRSLRSRQPGLRRPDRAVESEPRSVERHADDASIGGQARFCHQRAHVGMVVLNDDGFGVIVSPAPGQIVRVAVGHDRSWCDCVHVGEEFDRPLERLKGFDVAHVTDVLTHPGIPTVGDAERVLEFTTDGERRSDVRRQTHRQRRIAPRSSDRELARIDDAHHRVVARNMDRPIVGAERIGQRHEPSTRVVVVEHERFIADVAAGHHQQTG